MKNQKNGSVAIFVTGLVIAGGMAFALLQPSTSPTVAPTIPDAEQIAMGETLYEQKCAECHGSQGEGEYGERSLQPGDDGLLGAPPHDETGHTWHHDDDLLFRTIKEGRHAQGFRPMPGFEGALSDSEIDAVLTYIKQAFWTDEIRAIQAERTRLVRDQNS